MRYSEYAEIIRDPGLPRRRVEQHAQARAGEVDNTAYELWVSRRVFELLEGAYPGFTWFVECDLAKGGVIIALPILMGGNWVYFVRMVDLTPQRVIAAGGEILERYRLRRGAFELGAFLAARDKHSILIGRAKSVPE
jgi:hypothetical protein